MVASWLVRLPLFFFLPSSLLDSFTAAAAVFAAHAPWEKHHLGRRRCQREPGEEGGGALRSHTLSPLPGMGSSSLVSHVRINCRFCVVRALAGVRKNRTQFC